MSVQISSIDQFLHFITSNKLVVCYFTAQWCSACKVISPIIEQLANENKNIKFIKVDIDESVDLATKHFLTSMPTIKAYISGKEVDVIVGANKCRLMGIIELFNDDDSSNSSESSHF